MKKLLLFLTVVLIGLSAMAQTTYTKVTSESELNAGDKVLLVGYHENGTVWAMSYQKTNNRKAIEVTLSGDEITTIVAVDPSNQTDPYEITVGGQSGAWTFFDELTNGYLYAPGGGNYLKTQGTLDDKGQWTLSMDGDGFVPTSNGGVEQNIMRYNPNTQNNDPLFGCYKQSSNVTGLVYIYKAGGAPVINPEPSNYPTAVYSSHEMTDVTIGWTDATGAQLPAKYLVLASTGSITVPTDGTPVADGTLAKNVAYGVEEVTFTGLNPATTYHFAIFPYTNSGANINYKTDGNYPTANETTDDVVTLLSQDFETDLGEFTAYDVVGEQVWHQGTYQGKTYANMNGYAGGAAHENEDWLISPNLLEGDSYDMITISFENAVKFDGDALRVLYTEDTYAGGDPNQCGWVDITDNFEWSEGNYSWVETSYTLVDMDDVSNFTLAFKYTSTEEGAASWEITSIRVYGIGTDDVAENEATTISLYPNPATNVVSINAENAAEVQIIDMAGRTVMSVNVVEGENTISVADLNRGVYFVKMNGAVVKFVKR